MNHLWHKHTRFKTHTQTHTQVVLQVSPAHSLSAWDGLPEPIEVGLTDELQRLHHVPVKVLLAEDELERTP